MKNTLPSMAMAGLLLCAAAYAADAPPPPRSFKFADVARTPPMGWNSWNTFACHVDEKLVRETADAIVSSGMRDAGYVYVNIDDCWQAPERDADGFVQPDPKRFPTGIKALADEIHAKGLRLGIYSDAGEKTCGGYVGSQGHEYQDAKQYARWGVDYLKYDWCNTEGRNPVEAYRTMAKALLAAGRPIVFSVCEWGEGKPWTWAPPLGHLWRTTGDITSCFDCVLNHGGWSSNGILHILDLQADLRQYAGPGQWNDPDMMEVGRLSSEGEDRAHFAMWAMLAAPLIAGNDVRHMSEATRRTLTNKEVIAVDQDPLGVEGFPYKKEDGIEFWFKPLAHDAWAVAVLNRNREPRPIRFDWAAEHVDDGLSKRHTGFDEHTYALRNVLTGTDAGTTAQPLQVTVPGHDVAMFRLQVQP